MPYLGDSVAATASHICPYGIGSDYFGNVFIADPCHERIEVVNSSGRISSIAGNGLAGHSGDSGPATAATIDYPEELP
jgi:hypothetical protein